MSSCTYCHKPYDSLPFKCKFCGLQYCENCHLPESHHCSGLKKEERYKKLRGQYEEIRKKRLHREENIAPDTTSYFPESVFQKQPTYVNENTSSIVESKGWSIKNWITAFIVILFIASFLTNVGLFYYLPNHPGALMVAGNPKPVYFYDIDSSCNSSRSNINASLAHLSEATGVKFVQLPNPIALAVGGISYECVGTISSSPVGTVGEAEMSTYSMNLIFIFTSNKIRLLYDDEEIILHETLHMMGFSHRSDPNSIMYRFTRGYSTIDDDLVAFIQKNYVKNPLAYLNILTLNIICGLTLLYLISMKSSH